MQPILLISILTFTMNYTKNKIPNKILPSRCHLSVINTMDPMSGGPCQGIRNIFPSLNENGIRTEVVSLDNPDAPYIVNEAFKIHALGKQTNQWGYHKNLLPWLLENLCAYNVVIVHGLWLYHSYAVNKAIKILKKTRADEVPRIYNMPHGMLDPYFQKSKSLRLKAIRNSIYWHFIESKVIKSATGVLFTCEEELVLARETFSVYEPKLEYNIGYGIQSPPAKSDKVLQTFYKCVPKVAGKPFLLFISRIHPKKGVEFILDAYADFEINKPELHLPDLVIAGPGLDSPYGKMLKKKVNSSKLLKTKVHFPGMIQGDAKWGAIYACDAFILPSHQENFGIAVVEALSCNKPVLISNQINIFREIEIEGGGIVQADTLEGTKTQILAWIALSENERQEMQHAAKQTYLKYFTISIATKKMVAALWDQKDPENV